jgi:YD repeat-containing protein
MLGVNRWSIIARKLTAFFVYQYDVVGNGQAMTTTAGVVTYTYDAADRLTDANGGPYT